jgi:hypothetical protein
LIRIKAAFDRDNLEFYKIRRRKTGDEGFCRAKAERYVFEAAKYALAADEEDAATPENACYGHRAGH